MFGVCSVIRKQAAIRYWHCSARRTWIDNNSRKKRPCEKSDSFRKRSDNARSNRKPKKAKATKNLNNP